MTYAALMRAKRDEVVGEIRALLATTEGRGFTETEHARAQRLDTEADRLAASIQRAERADELAAMSADMRGITGPIVEGPGHMNTSTSDIRHLFEQYRTYGFAEAAFSLSDGFMRALQSAGGSAIPTSFYDRVFEYQRTATPMLDPNIVTVVPVPTGRPVVMPRLTADVAHGGTTTAEGAALNTLDPTISSITQVAVKYGTISVWSNELDLDSAINLEDLIARSTARELALDAGAHLTTGTGTVQPNGIVTASSAGSTAQGTATGTSEDGFYSWKDLVAHYYTLASPYRNSPRAAWMVSTDSMSKIRSFRDSNQMPYLVDPMDGGPERLLGKPVIENPAMASIASATRSVLFGDLSSYQTVLVDPVQITLSRDHKFGTDQVALRVVLRCFGDLPDTAAIKHMVSADT